MKAGIALCVFCLAAVALARPGEDHYTNRYDNIDLEEILNNKKVFDNYAKCILDLGKCTPDGKELKVNIKDALETACEKCTEIQKKGVRRVIGHLINKEEEYWNQLTVKYDPEKKFTTKYEKELREVKSS